MEGINKFFLPVKNIKEMQRYSDTTMQRYSDSAMQ